MATALAPTTRSSYHLNKQFACISTNSSPPFFSSLTHPHRPSLRLHKSPNFRFSRCLAASPAPPSPPNSDPLPPKDPIRLTGLAGEFSRIRDRAHIFFAVLFWMSLFFWISAWDGRSNGRPKKGSPFK